MAESNPLVVTAPQTSWTGTANMKAPTSFTNAGTDLEGAGLFSDAASTLSDATTAKGWTSGAAEMDLASDGMDAIGMAMDPFGSLAGAGIGWLIEHIGFLKKPLDYLAGDPEEVTAKQQTWENIAKALNDAATRYQQSATTMKGSNSGDAVNGVHTTATNFATVLTGAASHASDAAEAMKVAGVVVGTTRGVIRDSLSQFAGDAIVKWIAATAAAFFTFGATEAAFVVDEVAEGTSLAVQDASKVTKALQFLEKLTGHAKDSSAALEKAGKSIAKDSGKDVAETAGKDTAKTAAKDTGRTAPKDTAESTTPSSASDGSSATAHDQGTTAPKDTSESTAPSSASDGSSATVKDQGTTAPKDPNATAPQSTELTPEQIRQQATDHIQMRDAHNQAVAQHNTDAANFRAQSAEHNTKAIENTQKMAENDHARRSNQQAINRARAEGKQPHPDLKAQHRQLETEHKNLRQEDTRLSAEQKQLEQRHQDLNNNAKDINANAKHLNAEQDKLKHEVGEGWLKQHSLRSEHYEGSKAQLAGEHLSDDSKGMHNLSTYDPKKLLAPAGWKPSTVLHDGLPGVPKPTLGDAVGVAKEAGHQALSDQPTREGKIAEEYQLKQEELAHQAQESGGEQKPAWPTSEQTTA